MGSFNIKYFKTKKWNSLNIYEKTICLYIDKRYDKKRNTYVKIETIINELGIAKATLYKYLKLLEEKEIIKIYKHSIKSGLANEYELLDIKEGM